MTSFNILSHISIFNIKYMQYQYHERIKQDRDDFELGMVPSPDTGAIYGIERNINCVADVVRRGRLRWFGHLERKSVDDWVSACRRLVVEGTRGRGRSRKTWERCVRDDMKLLGLHPEWAIFRDMWRDLIWGQTSNPSLVWKNGRFQNK